MFPALNEMCSLFLGDNCGRLTNLSPLADVNSDTQIDRVLSCCQSEYHPWRVTCYGENQLRSLVFSERPKLSRMNARRRLEAGQSRMRKNVVGWIVRAIVTLLAIGRLLVEIAGGEHHPIWLGTEIGLVVTFLILAAVAWSGISFVRSRRRRSRRTSNGTRPPRSRTAQTGLENKPRPVDPRYKYPRVTKEDAWIRSNTDTVKTKDGEYLVISAVGSYDNTVGIYLRQVAFDAHAETAYRGTVFDCSGLYYSWGDSILAHFFEIAVRTKRPVFVLVGDYSARGLRSLFNAFAVDQSGDTSIHPIRLIESIDELTSRI